MLATLTGKEVFEVIGQFDGGLPCGQSETTTVAAVAALAGSGIVRQISSGTTDTATTSDSVIAWNSATSGAKTQNIPAGTFNGQAFTVVDEIGTCGNSGQNITLNIVGGTINGASTFVMNINGQSITMKWNGNSNYIIV